MSEYVRVRRQMLMLAGCTFSALPPVFFDNVQHRDVCCKMTCTWRSTASCTCTSSADLLFLSLVSCLARLLIDEVFFEPGKERPAAAGAIFLAGAEASVQTRDAGH